MKDNINAQDSGDFLNILFDNIVSAIFLLDKDYQVTKFNKSFKRIFFDDQERLAGGTCNNVVECKYSQEKYADCGKSTHCTQCDLRNSVIRAIAQNVPMERGQITREFYKNHVKELKYLRYTTKYINYEAKEMIMVIVDDVTELETQRFVLQEINQSKDKLFSIISHDLKSPLNSLSGFSNFLINYIDHISKEEIVEYGKKLDKGIKNMYRLLENLLDWSRTQTGQLELKVQSISLHNLLESNIELLRNSAIEKSIELNTRFETDKMAHCDANSMNTVIRNLLSNAIKFTPIGGEITIETGGSNDQVWFVISDSGIGMDAQTLSVLFRVGNKTSRNGTANEKGSGIGMVLCKEFIDLNNGTIEVQSEPDNGCTVRVSLPKA
ncbi:MAG: ATP-binding protein [Cyclobacteriaceae bacterium]